MATVKQHTRVVNGRRQVVKAHRRQLQPGRARANARKAVRHGKRRSYGPAVACAAVAAAELGGWLALRGAGIALVTVGIAALGIGVAARRATPSTPRPTYRSSGTVRRVPPGTRPASQPRQPSMTELGRRAAAADHSSPTGYGGAVVTPKFSGEDDPRSAEWNRAYNNERRRLDSTWPEDD